jgi:predicted O-linked N-acetylglucosamine transferase (SPINDLY family)
MPSDPRRTISDREFTRSELGLPDTGFVFCCFNNSYKITPAVFDRWMKILQGVEGSVLWLSDDNVTAVSNLKMEASSRGIDPKRLIFASRMPLPADHLARLRVADLFLDTLPYNAHATANDALWAGLPVLTLQGETFQGRVAASLLNAIGLPEMVVTTAEAYVALAIGLATDPERLQAIRRKLASNRLSTPLFDRSLTRHIEDIYAAIYERHMQDLPPGHIYPGVRSC